jgi:hypothetical protein
VIVNVALRGGDRLDDNRSNWDERVPMHVASDFSDQEPLRRGQSVPGHAAAGSGSGAGVLPRLDGGCHAC